MHIKRKCYMDYLRIISFVEVVAIHLSFYLFSNIDGWKNKAFSGIVAFAIPMFTMISGANILERGYSLKEIWHRKVWKLFVAFILTSAGYLFWDFFEEEPFSILGEISTFITGRYHMWYLYMICGLYIITPILNSIIAKRELLFYLCGISFVVSFLFPAIEALEIATFSVAINKVNICMGSGYLFYYLLGYILDHEINIEKVKSSVVFTVALVLTILEIVLGLSGDFSILTGIAAGMWFLFFKKAISNEKSRVNGVIEKAARLTFGAYLIHVWILECNIHLFELANIHIEGIISWSLIAIIALESLLMSYLIDRIISNFRGKIRCNNNRIGKNFMIGNV